MKIFFVRHGQSELNVESKEQGDRGSLSAFGRKQANSLGKRFSAIPIDLIVSSTYPRAKETSEFLNHYLNKQVMYSDLLIERKPPSRFIGVRTDDPEYLKVKELMTEKRLVDPSWRYEDEESFLDLKKRALSVLDFLKSQDKKSILVVTHNDFLKALISVLLFGEKLTYFEYFKVFMLLGSENASSTLVEYFDETRTKYPGWKLMTWNDYAHLELIK